MSSLAPSERALSWWLDERDGGKAAFAWIDWLAQPPSKRQCVTSSAHRRQARRLRLEARESLRPLLVARLMACNREIAIPPPQTSAVSPLPLV